MQGRKFCREFKLEEVRMVRERGVAVAQAARDLDVPAAPQFVSSDSSRPMPVVHSIPGERPGLGLRGRSPSTRTRAGFR